MIFLKLFLYFFIFEKQSVNKNLAKKEKSGNFEWEFYRSNVFSTKRTKFFLFF